MFISSNFIAECNTHFLGVIVYYRMIKIEREGLEANFSLDAVSLIPTVDGHNLNCLSGQVSVD